MEYGNIDEKDLGRVKKLTLLSIIPILFLLVGISYGIYRGNTDFVLNGFINIILTPTILVTDFIQVGGVEAAFINVGLIGFLNIFIMQQYRLK